MGLIIKHLEYYLPEKVISNEELQLENPDWDIKKVEEKSGVLSRHIADESQTALDLGIKAVEKLFENNDIKKENIEAIMFCTQSPDYIMPSNSFLIHKHFNFDKKTWCFDYDLACSAYVFGLSIIRGIVQTNLAKNVLLITADTYSRYINKKDRSTSILFGDGATASILCNNEERGIIDVMLASSGKSYDTFYIPAGGCKSPKSSKTKEDLVDMSGNVQTMEDIHMNGFSVWQFISKEASEQIGDLLLRNNLTVEDIDLFVFHQASKLTINSLMKKLNIKEDQVFNNLEFIGNTVSSSIPIALKDAETQGQLKKNNLILLSGFGVGLSWGSIIMKY